MQIQFKKVMPIPLQDAPLAADSIWGKDVTLNSGERILLNAASGKGKSTFTYVVAGLRRDYAGMVTYDGQLIQNFKAEEWAEIKRSKISVVHQDLQLFPNLTVRENLKLKSDLIPVFSEEVLKSKLEFLGIGDKWNQKCGLLSMGQQQRVAILRALNQPYEWLIMDEPFSHLDTENAQKCMKLIHDRTLEQNAGFVLTTLGDEHNYQYSNVLTL